MNRSIINYLLHTNVKRAARQIYPFRVIPTPSRLRIVRSRSDPKDANGNCLQPKIRRDSGRNSDPLGRKLPGMSSLAFLPIGESIPRAYVRFTRRSTRANALQKLVRTGEGRERMALAYLAEGVASTVARVRLALNAKRQDFHA